MRKAFGEMINQLEKMAKGEGNIYEHCPIVNTKLPVEMCRIPKRVMDCPIVSTDSDAFCCKDCPEFPNCDAKCIVAVKLTEKKEAG